MNAGDTVRLVPGISRARENTRSNDRFKDTMRALSEDVLIIDMETTSGNAKVRDSRGIVFLCNPDDLSEIDPIFYAI